MLLNINSRSQRIALLVILNTRTEVNMKLNFGGKNALRRDLFAHLVYLCNAFHVNRQITVVQKKYKASWVDKQYTPHVKVSTTV